MDSSEQDTIFLLRKRVNNLEKEKLDAFASANQEVSQLMADVARLTAQLEKGEATRLNIEYELAKVNRDLAAERRLAAEKESDTAATFADLQKKVEELSSQNDRLTRDLASSHQSTEQESSRLSAVIQSKDKLISEQSARIATCEEARSELQSNMLQKQKIIETLESEIERLQGTNRQLTEDIRKERLEMDVLRDRTSKVNQELGEAYVQVQTLEQAIEAERATHIQTKFSCDLTQLRVQDLESALKAERDAKAEAVLNAEKLTNSLRELQKLFDDQRKEASNMQAKLTRTEKELEGYNRQLTMELGDKKSLIGTLSEQIQLHQSELGQLKGELGKAKKRQVLLDEAYVGAVSELQLILSSSDVNIKKAQFKDMVSCKALSGVVQNVRELVQSYWKSNSQLTTSMSAQKRQIDKLSQDVKDYKEKLSAKTKSLKEKEDLLSQAKADNQKAVADCKRIEKENHQLSSELQRLKQGLVDQQTQSQQLRDQMLRVSLKCKADEQTSATFLSLLHQQLNSAILVADGSGNIALQSHGVSSKSMTSEPADWNDLALLVNEQVSVLVAQHNRAHEKVSELEHLLKLRDQAMDKLNAEHVEQLDRLRQTSEHQAQRWIKDKSSIERRYEQMLSDSDSRIKQLQHDLDDAWHKIRSLGAARRELDATCSQVRQRADNDRRDVDGLVVAVALLCGCLIPLSARAAALASQRDLLCRQLRLFETFKCQVADLVSAMTFTDSSTTTAVGSLPYRRPSLTTALLRFRVAVVAVLAANRLSRGLRACRAWFTAYNAVHSGPANLVVCLGRSVRSSGDVTNMAAMNWLRDTALRQTIVSSTADLETLTTGEAAGTAGQEANHSAVVARSCFNKLISRVAEIYSGHEGKQQEIIDCRATLADRLKQGLENILNNDNTDVPGSRSLSYSSSEDVLSGLRRCVLDFTNRLHSAEVERQDLKRQVHRLRQSERNVHDEKDSKAGSQQRAGDLVSKEKFDDLLTQLTEALQREQTMQDLISEQSVKLEELNQQLQVGRNLQQQQRHRQLSTSGENDRESSAPPDESGTHVAQHQYLQQLTAKVDMLEREKKSLQENVRDAEHALRTAAKDKQALVTYVASVEKCFVDSDGKQSPPDRLISLDVATPTMLGGRKSRQSSSLQLVQALVTAFIEAYNVVVERFVASQQDVRRLNDVVERLKADAVEPAADSEDGSVNRHFSAEVTKVAEHHPPLLSLVCDGDDALTDKQSTESSNQLTSPSSKVNRPRATQHQSLIKPPSHRISQTSTAGLRRHH